MTLFTDSFSTFFEPVIGAVQDGVGADQNIIADRDGCGRCDDYPAVDKDMAAYRYVLWIVKDGVREDAEFPRLAWKGCLIEPVS